MGANLENLILYSSVIGTGNAQNNVITGNSSANTLNGGDGIDTLIGGTGNDTYMIDTITENVNEGTDLVQASVNYTLAANVENLTLTGTSNINGSGNILNNVITGNNANNILDGGIGDDTLNGGAGNDTYLIDITTDTITENTNQGTDTVSSSVSYVLGVNLENLTLTGTGNINGTGNTLNNVLTGDNGNNILNAGDGNDTIDGGAGIDTLIGGTGNDLLMGGSGNDSLTGGVDSDRFIYHTNAVFTTSAVGIDRIADFVSGTDKIVLDKTTFTMLGSVIGSGFNVATEFAVVGSDAAASTSGALIVYSSGTGNLFYNQNDITTGFGSGVCYLE